MLTLLVRLGVPGPQQPWCTRYLDLRPKFNHIGTLMREPWYRNLSSPWCKVKIIKSLFHEICEICILEPDNISLLATNNHQLEALEGSKWLHFRSSIVIRCVSKRSNTIPRIERRQVMQISISLSNSTALHVTDLLWTSQELSDQGALGRETPGQVQESLSSTIISVWGIIQLTHQKLPKSGE